nr:MAK10-like protein [Tanacetum cinerariifolium]
MGTMWCLFDPTPSSWERTCLCLFQFFLRDQDSYWIERLLAGSISTWEDLTDHFLAQFFPPRRTSKLCNDILMIQKHQGETLSKAWTPFKDLLQKFPHHEDLALYDNKSWNDPRDFAKPIKAISMPQDVPCTSDRRLIELENQVQRLMEANLAPNQPIQVNKITSSCEICSAPHDTQYCMENLSTLLLTMYPRVLTKQGVSELIPQHQSHYLLKILYPVSIYNFIIMLNTNNNMQTQTSNTLHNAIMEAGSKDRPLMLAPGNYVQWKSKIKRYIDTKPNHELIHYCLKNPPYELGWIDKEILISERSPITRTERFQETHKNVSQDICDQLNAEAKAVQIILTGIDNDIYSTVDACPNECEMWKAIERLKQGESINVQDLKTNLYWEFGKFTSHDGESLKSYYSRFYKMLNELIRNQCKVTNHQVNVQFLLQLQQPE